MKPQVVSFRCILRDTIGKLVSTTVSQDVITHHEGAPQGRELPGLARRMKNLRKGERRRILLGAAEAYGLYNPDLVIEAPRRGLGALRLGDQVHVQDGEGRLRPYRVIRLNGRTATLDANHPLAGQDLTFDIEVMAARYATAEEIAESNDGPAAPARWVH
ncbi:MAG: peptidylprolyl isomerase [Chitinophagaceae bacterium]|nr:MAG: peptidylprolyl isomerase [Chitinophagaceae bacterium]